MSVIDLKKRHTSKWEEMNLRLQSPDSFVYITPPPQGVNPSSMDLEVGDQYILPGTNSTFKISDAGLVIKPHRAVVIITKQRIKLPYNVFGVITGKGEYIYKGCFLSTGKIDPAFDGYLKIGFLNESNSDIKLTKGDKFATAFFLNTDVTLTAPLNVYQNDLSPMYKKIKWYTKTWYWLNENYKVIIPWIIAMLMPMFKLYELITKGQ